MFFSGFDSWGVDLSHVYEGKNVQSIKIIHIIVY